MSAIRQCRRTGALGRVCHGHVDYAEVVVDLVDVDQGGRRRRPDRGRAAPVQFRLQEGWEFPKTGDFWAKSC